MNELGYDPFKGIDGTAAAPAFSFKDEPDTGVYRKTTDTIGFAAGGAEIASLAAKALAMGQSAKIFFGSSTLADDGEVALPAHTVFMFGIVLAKAGATFAIFYATAAGAVTLVSNTSDVVANADTDARLDIGITNPDNPIEIKNRLGATYDVNYFIVYY
jgi:hypothetical protein